ncbi:MAG: carboxypeptidase-like regulatory domain-containing protein [Flavobacteriaceae bacterium]|nr:carboxypeptidase-like regulatory domain-containing protein [Flavobacteriaceae bacterium]
MQKSITTTVFIILLSTVLNGQSNQFDSYQKEWKQVEQFELKGLTASASDAAEKIYKKAKKRKNHPQIIKSLIYKSKFALLLEEDAQLKVIDRLKAEIATSSYPTKNILESILADLYWQYFQQNRWKFYNRTSTSEKVDPNDFRTWDLQTLFEEAHIHYQKSLQDALLLQKTYLGYYADILSAQQGSIKLRPTLYDFLAHRAIDFYKTDERNLQRPSYKFEIKNENLLADNESFIKEELASKDSLSQQLHALKLFKNLTLFHLKDKYPDALINLTLARLDFVKTNAVFNDKETVYLETLKSLFDTYKDNDISTEIAYRVGLALHKKANKYVPFEQEENRWKNKDALEICETAIAKFPVSSGAQKCKSLKQQILHKSLKITNEKFVPINKSSRLLVSYKNMKRLSFKTYQITEEEERSFNKIYNDSAKIAFINTLELIENWEVQLKDEKDYQTHKTEVIVPQLKQGRYLLVASSNERLSKNETFGYSSIQVTDLALIDNSKYGTHTYQVVDRTTGKPIQNARVDFKNYDTGRYNKAYQNTLITNSKGLVSFSVDQRYSNIVITVTKDKDKGVFGNYYLNKGYKPKYDNSTQSRIFLFTDRSIYRPGQTVYFKGIAVAMKTNRSEVIANKKITVALKDVNYQEIKKIELKTNEFGSFSAEFLLPGSGLTGNFHIEAGGHTGLLNRRIYGSTYFSVEEYKRPKFETEFNPITDTFRINDSISVKGFAKAFAGSTISDAKVAYRVYRTAQYPKWYWYYRPRVTSERQEITHGETTTDAEGNFEVVFKALPDLKVSPNTQPTFNYRITADITDINGETRSTETTVNVGYHALDISMALPDKLDKAKNHKILVTTNNLNGEFVPTKGSLKIYKLKAPDRVLRKRPWAAPDYQVIPKDEFQQLFPNDAFSHEDNPKKWEKGALVFETQIDTEKSKEVNLNYISKWVSGTYIAEFVCKDKFDQEVRDERRFAVFGTNDKKVADSQLFFIKTNKAEYTPGDNVRISLGTASKNTSVTLLIDKNYSTVDTKVVHLSDEIKTITIPVKEKDRGGFAIHYQLVAHNSFENGMLPISVPYPKHELEIETSTFRDKLQPGQEETWSFKVKGSKGDKVAAELLASMYEASLDQFRGHQWYLNAVNYRYYYPYRASSAGYSFGIVNFNVYNLNNIYHGFSGQGYDQLNWFGLSFRNNDWANRNYIRNLKLDRDKWDKVVSGTVSDESGPLPGVSIRIKGTAYGTETDFDGNYSIKVNNEDVLVFSFIGFTTKEINASKSKRINLVMEGDQQLDEVVVVGYGTTKRKRAKLERTAAPMQVLQDKISGVQAEAIVANEEEVEGDVAFAISENGFKRAPEKVDLSGIVARRNLQETAFFYPHLTTDAKGNISFNFTVPESLTRWKLQLLAHTEDLQIATQQLTTVTQKDLMVLPNPPRFFREGDRIVFASKIANLSEKNLNGVSELQLFDALTNKPIDSKLGNLKNQKSFSIGAKGNTNVSWNLKIPDDVLAVKYKIVAKAGEFTDGEENALPVLSNRMLVTETLPMWLRSGQTKTFTLDKLKSNESTTLKNHNLTLEITSNPAWYAVQALPYLMEYPYECSEQTFSRYYANALGSHIANSNPRIQEVFKHWKSGEALLSNLEKNQELKSLIIQETPWLRNAQSETEQKKRIALLFDLNKMNNELSSTLRKLKQLQMNNGGFPWFKGSRYPNRFITQHIALGFGHLKKLNVNLSSGQESQIREMTVKAVKFLDDELLEDYRKLEKQAKRIHESAKNKTEGAKREAAFWKKNHTGHYQIQYLYMRSFYKDIRLNDAVQKAIDYYTGQAYDYWLDRNLYTKGMIALIAKRNDHAAAEKILASLKENAITSEELGMYWKENTASWYWYQAPIETQALLIEAFSEIEGDPKVIDELKVWLLKHKQTNRWNTTKATTEAVYALLLQGSDWLQITDFVTVKIGKEKIDPLVSEDTKVEAGTGYFKTSWKGNEIQPEMSVVKLSKKSDGIAWGALYWQYFEDLDKITSAETPLKLKKQLFLKRNSDKGEELLAITPATDLNLGDLVKVRIELRVDRVMEFIHMKDMRAAGFEPVNVLSRYKWQDGLGYYESTKDAATNFFFDYLPKGVYVFEYDLRVNNKGDFSNGITTIQSMYAPEFSSHSEGVRIKVN